MKQKLDITLPAAWRDMTDDMLLYWLRQLAAHQSAYAARTVCAMKWAGLTLVGRYSKGIATFCRGPLTRKTREYYRLTPDDVATITNALGWMDTLPETPMRPDRIAGRAAIQPALHEVPFGTYLAVESGYQAFLATKDYVWLDTAADILYPPAPKEKKLSDDDRHLLRITTLWWWQSLKRFLAGQFENLFIPVAESSDDFAPRDPAREFRDSVNAQLRALTKGDIARENEIQQADLWRALTELDAQARESKEPKTIAKQ